jgi:hypothetical protein
LAASVVYCRLRSVTTGSIKRSGLVAVGIRPLPKKIYFYRRGCVTVRSLKNEIFCKKLTVIRVGAAGFEYYSATLLTCT